MKLMLDKNLISMAKLFNPYAKIYVVGGAIRDLILNKKPKDFDICSRLTIYELQTICKDLKIKIGNKNFNFGTATIIYNNNQYDYACLREEKYKKSGVHYPNSVKFVKSLKKDSKRRDFTINALYCNILTGKIYDYHGGLKDLKKQKIKTVLSPKKTLKNDGERILRMIKYSVDCSFEIEEKTFFYAKKYIENLKQVRKKIIDNFIGYYSLLDKTKQKRVVEILKNLNASTILNLL